MGKPHILIADDEQYIRLLASRLLSDKFAVLEASDGAKAVDMARKHKPSLILMDIMMPNMDGYTACSKIKTDQSTKKIPVVMLTGLGFELNKKLAQTAGADGYITKPFTLEKLLDAIGKVVEIPK
ncbi:response regulator [Chloroflexota bacterium]